MVVTWQYARTCGLWLILLGCAATVPALPRPPAQDPHASAMSTQVQINASRVFQTMEGFGSSVRLFDDPHLTETHDPSTGNSAVVLTNSQENEILDRLYVDLGLTRIRPTTGRGIERENDNGSARRTRLEAFDFSGRRNDGFVDYVKRAAQRGARVFFLSPLKGESWMNLDAAGADEYCEWALAVIRRWRELGVLLPYYSVFNEPSVAVGPRAGEFIHEVIKRLGPMLRADGLETKFVVSDDIGPQATYETSRRVLADKATRPYVGALATHMYHGQDLSQLAALSEEYRIPLWMTEFFDGRELGWAGTVTDLLVRYNVSAIDYMWGFFGEWDNAHLIRLRYNGPRAANYNPAEGPVYRGYEPTKVYYAFGQFSRFVKPGARRIGADCPDPKLKVSAFTHHDDLVIVVVNERSEPARVTFMLNDFMPDSEVNAVRTSEDENWAALNPVPATASSFTAEIRQRSTTTFLLTGKSAPSAPSVSAPPVARPR